MTDEAQSNSYPSPVQDNPWQDLRQFTAARIALGRTGASLPTAPQLAFQLAHAQARDAVHFALPVTQLHADLSSQLQAYFPAPMPAILHLHSAATDRRQYLQRPDLGRKLDSNSQQKVRAAHCPATLAIVLADGLSSLAIARHAAPFLRAFLRRMRAQPTSQDWQLAPLCIVQQARVAIGDEIAACLGAQMVVVLIGERPGLSSPDSMGLYLTYRPQPGMHDAQRNCISNVRPDGLNYEDAAIKLLYLLEQANLRQISGVNLKDESIENTAVFTEASNFLLGN